jgi:dTDP-4-dehydrorhamnose 3,5-epimerase
MKVTPSEIAGVVFIDPDVFADQRGAFTEMFRADRYEALGLPRSFVQDNVSRSTHGVLRGLHLQHPKAQAKLVVALEGEIFDVAVDVRVGSPTFGRSVSAVLSAANHRQMLIPPGFAHGFLVTSSEALVAYKCTEFYAPESERAIAWNDPALGIAWPLASPTLSPRDAAAPRLSEIASDRLPGYP